MGKKKASQQHQADSFGNMVSRAALTQLLPHIEGMVNELGSQLQQQQQSTFQLLYTRLVAVEQILIEKGVATQEDMMNRIADLEDKREGLTTVDTVAAGDTVRIAIRTKTEDQPEFQGSSKLKVMNVGTGNTIGKEVESEIVGMKAGDLKEVKFGQNKEIVAEIKVDRVGRPLPPQVLTPAPAPQA